MTSREINELLANMICMYAPAFGRKITSKVALKLATSSIDGQIQNISGDTYVLAKAAFSKCGTILEENRADKIISGVIFAGAANMNPSFVILWVEGNNIHIKASAKEGLVKQHTAERTVNIFKSAFNNRN